MPSVLFEINHQVAKITLNRPAKLNAITREMSLEIQRYLDLCADDPQVRAIHLTGAGKGFCVGQDLLEIKDYDSRSPTNILSELYHPIVRKIRNMPKPVLAAVNGVAAGAGANIALCCDVVIAAASATFVQAFAKLGLIPDSGGTYFLPRLIGWQKASAVCMLGDQIKAVDAERWGMIYRVYPDTEFEDQVNALSATLAALPTGALGLIKQALNHSMSATLESQLLLEEELQQRALKTNDHQEGMAAFAQKRSALFNGD